MKIKYYILTDALDEYCECDSYDEAEGVLRNLLEEDVMNNEDEGLEREIVYGFIFSKPDLILKAYRPKNPEIIIEKA